MNFDLGFIFTTLQQVSAIKHSLTEMGILRGRRQFNPNLGYQYQQYNPHVHPHNQYNFNPHMGDSRIPQGTSPHTFEPKRRKHRRKRKGYTFRKRSFYK